MFEMKIKTDGSAFDGGVSGTPDEELRLMLERVRRQLADGRRDGMVLDSNGNICGSWSWTA